METGNVRVEYFYCSRENTRLKISGRPLPTQDLELTNIGAEQKSLEKKLDRSRKCKRSEKDVDELSDSSVESKIRSAKKNCDKAPLKNGRLLKKEREEISIQELPLKECRRSFLKAKVAKLKKETFRLRREVISRSEDCSDLKESNSVLLDTLKKICEPNVIKQLEAINPANS